MTLSDVTFMPFLVGALSTAGALVFVEKWKKRNSVLERLILLEQTVLNMKDSIKMINDKISALDQEFQESTKQVTTNTVLLNQAKEDHDNRSKNTA